MSVECIDSVFCVIFKKFERNEICLKVNGSVSISIESNELKVK